MLSYTQKYIIHFYAITLFAGIIPILLKSTLLNFVDKKKRISINQEIGFSRNTVIRSTQQLQLDQTPNHILNDCPAQRRFGHFILTIEYGLVYVHCPSFKFIHTDFFLVKKHPIQEGGADISKSMRPKKVLHHIAPIFPLIESYLEVSDRDTCLFVSYVADQLHHTYA